MPDFIIFDQILRIFHQSRVNRPESFELEAPVAPRAVTTLIRKVDDKNGLPEHFHWDKNHKRQDIKNPPALSILKMALQPQKVSPPGIDPIAFTDKSDLRSYFWFKNNCSD